MFQGSLCIQLLSKHMLGLTFTNFHMSSFFSYLNSLHIFQDSLSIQLFGLHSPSTCKVQNFQIFTRDHFFMLTLSTRFRIHSPYSYLVYTLQAHVRFKIFKFSREIIFHAYTLHTCFRFHSPYSYLVYTLQARVRFKISNFRRSYFFSCLHSPYMFQDSLSIQLFGLHSPSTC